MHHKDEKPQNQVETLDSLNGEIRKKTYKHIQGLLAQLEPIPGPIAPLHPAADQPQNEDKTADKNAAPNKKQYTPEYIENLITSKKIKKKLSEKDDKKRNQPEYKNTLEAIKELGKEGHISQAEVEQRSIELLIQNAHFSDAIKELYLYKDQEQGIESHFIKGTYDYEPAPVPDSYEISLVSLPTFENYNPSRLVELNHGKPALIKVGNEIGKENYYFLGKTADGKWKLTNLTAFCKDPDHPEEDPFLKILPEIWSNEKAWASGEPVKITSPSRFALLIADSKAHTQVFKPAPQPVAENDYMDIYWRDARKQSEFLAHKEETKQPRNDAFQSWLIIAINYVQAAMDRIEFAKLENKKLQDPVVRNKIRSYFANELVKLFNLIKDKHDQDEIKGAVGDFLHHKLVHLVSECCQTSTSSEWEYLNIAKNFSPMEFDPFATVTIIRDHENNALANVELPIFQPAVQEIISKNESPSKKQEFINYMISTRSNKSNRSLSTQLRTLRKGIRNAAEYHILKRLDGKKEVSEENKFISLEDVGGEKAFSEILSAHHAGNIGHHFGTGKQNQAATTEVVEEILNTLTEVNKAQRKADASVVNKDSEKKVGENKADVIGFNPDPNLLFISLVSPGLTPSYPFIEEIELHEQVRKACNKVTKNKKTTTGQKVWYADLPINPYRGWLPTDKTGIHELAAQAVKLQRVIDRYLKDHVVTPEQLLAINKLKLCLEQYHKLITEREKKFWLLRVYPFDRDNYHAQIVALCKVMASIYNENLDLLNYIPKTCLDTPDQPEFRPIDVFSFCKSTKDREGIIRAMTVSLVTAIDIVARDATNNGILFSNRTQQGRDIIREALGQVNYLYQLMMKAWVRSRFVQLSAGINTLGNDGCVGNSRSAYPQFLENNETDEWLFPKQADYNKAVPSPTNNHNAYLLGGLLFGVALVAATALVIGVLVATKLVALPLILAGGGAAVQAIAASFGATVATGTAASAGFAGVAAGFLAGCALVARGIKKFSNWLNRPKLEDLQNDISLKELHKPEALGREDQSVVHVKKRAANDMTAANTQLQVSVSNDYVGTNKGLNSDSDIIPETYPNPDQGPDTKALIPEEAEPGPDPNELIPDDEVPNPGSLRRASELGITTFSSKPNGTTEGPVSNVGNTLKK